MRPTRLLPGLALALGAAAATAQTSSPTSFKEYAVTVYGAYRFGGSFTDSTNGQSLRLDNSAAWAISYDRNLDGIRQLQFYASYQSTHLRLGQSVAVTPPPTVNPLSAPAPTELPMRVIYLQIGGTNFLDGPIGEGAYLVGGLGATVFAPETGGYSDEVRPSMNLGLGYQTLLGGHFALRFEARGYLTVVNSSGGLFCSGGCVLKIKGQAVSQGEAQLGLSYRF